MSKQNLPLILTHFLGARWRWHTLRGTALTAYQERRARHMISYVAQHAPFYREHWSGYDLNDWRNLPTVDKQVMMQHFDTFNTRSIKRDEAMEVAIRAERSRDFRPQLAGVTVGLSSGTSGHRGLFLANQWEQAAWAGTMLARTLHSLQPRRLRVAFFLRSNSNLYEQIGSSLLQFHYFDLMLPPAQTITQLNSLLPHIIVGPPSLLRFLAQARQHGDLHIHPERLISVAEVLEAQDRTYITDAFNAPVHQIYQCTEGLLAISCERGALHIQEDIVVLQFEPLADPSNAQGEGAEHNEQQHERVMPIVTDLWRKTQPIIRYRLNDVLQLETQPCPCGSPFRVISSIEGRSDDICLFMSQHGGVRPFYPDIIRRMILLASPHIADYQAIQHQTGQLTIRLNTTEEGAFEHVALAVRASVASTLQQYGCQPAIVSIEQGVEPPAAGAKLRRVRRMTIP